MTRTLRRQIRTVKNISLTVLVVLSFVLLVTLAITRIPEETKQPLTDREQAAYEQTMQNR